MVNLYNNNNSENTFITTTIMDDDDRAPKQVHAPSETLNTIYKSYGWNLWKNFA